MPSDSSPDTAIDRLYQLPLGEFVAARNQLAREASGEESARIRALAKPNVIAWALNQLYWVERPVFDRLLASAARLRAAQAEALRGGTVDLRAADADHRKAVREALGAVSRILEGAGHEATPDAVRALTAAFEALPWPDRPGRLVRPPAPSGFGALAGLPIAPRAAAEASEGRAPAAAPRQAGATRKPAAKTEAPSRREREAEAAKLRERQERLAEARARRDAARRAASEAAADAKEHERRVKALRKAEQEANDRLEQARRALKDGEAAYREALRREMDSARQLRDAEAALERSLQDRT